MLTAVDLGFTRAFFCYAFCGFTAVWCCLNHLFYYNNVKVALADIDQAGNVDPDQVKDKAPEQFVWAEVLAILGSTELLLLAFIQTLNSVCAV